MYQKKSMTNNFQEKIVSLDELVPQDNNYRLIQKLIDWNIVRSFFDSFYSHSGRGRKGYDPVIIVKIFLIQYIEGFSSVRRTIEKIKVDISLRWFLCLGFDDDVPDHSTLSHLYNSHFKNTNVFARVFNYVLGLAYAHNLIDSEIVSVDSTHVKANANPHKYTSAYVREEISSIQERIEQELTDSINQDRNDHNKKNLKKKELTPLYSDQLILKIKEVETLASKTDLKDLNALALNFEEKKKRDPILREALNWIQLSYNSRNKNHCIIHFPSIVQNGKLIPLNLAQIPVDLNDYSIKKVSKTDPESGWFHKGEHKHNFAYVCEVACDKNNFILSYQPFPGNEHDSKTFLKWEGLFELDFNVLVADAGYKSSRVVHFLLENGIVPLLPYTRPMTKDGFFRKYEYVFDESDETFICPNLKDLHYKTTNRNSYREFESNPYDCKKCPYLDKCTQSQNHIKQINQHVWFEEMELIEDLRYSLSLKDIYSLRKETIERVFADCKENHHLRYTNYRGIERMDFTCTLAFTAANILKIIHLLNRNEEQKNLSDPNNI